MPILLAVIIIITIFPIFPLPKASSDLSNPSSLKSHDPIHINGNSQFMKSNGVVKGTGTQNNPYIIENWDINATLNNGIQIENTNAYFIIRNCYVYNGSLGSPMKHGIFFKNVRNGVVKNNRLTNNQYGIYLNNSDGNIISNNTCISNIYHGIFLLSSSNNTITNNIAISNHLDAILLRVSSNDNIIIKNIVNESQSGIVLILDCDRNIIIGNIANSNWPYHGINLHDTCNENFIANNIANSNGDDGIILWIDCMKNLVFNNTANSNGEHGIVIGRNSTENIITNNTSNLNNDSGIYIFRNSKNNIIKNCSISLNSKYDFKLMGYCKNNIAINTSFDTIYVHDPTSKLIIKNYLHIKVKYTNGFPTQGVDLEVKDNNETIYATPDFGGSEPKTNVHGQIKWILVTDRIYNGSSISTENITTMTVKFDDIEILNNYREVNMSTSHFENFTINQSYNFLPTKINLTSPFNNSFINDPTPELKWAAGTDGNGDLLTYHVQVKDLDCDWNSLIINRQTGIGVLTWSISTPLMDGTYQWRVCAHDGFGNGSWSDAWKFTVDTTPPTSTVTSPVNDRFYNSLKTISGTAYDLMNGSGLFEVEIVINRLIDDYYWAGVTWVSRKVWLLASGTTEWEYNSTGVKWTSGIRYKVQSRGTDLVTNVEVPNIANVFTYDSKNVIFSNARPVATIISPIEEVKVGVTISDATSGVNSSTIEYAISNDKGITWTPWVAVTGYKDDMIINVTLCLAFPNGTGNRIKWRATDIAGNGPAESEAYIVNVYIWQPIPYPRVRLWGPSNNSTIITKSVNLVWLLENENLLKVTYDAYLDTINPPDKIFQSGIINTNLTINGLINGETYYWTIIPKLGEYKGCCLSGIWSFKVDIPIPKVKLLTPENGSIIKSVKPTLSWSVEYYGTEILKYDIHLDSRKDPGIEYKNYTNKYYLPKRLLEKGKTYYWKVVPWVGDLKGLESEIWYFSIDEIDEMPRFDLELHLEPSVVELEPGSIKDVIANVTNLGDLTDSISVYVITPPNVKFGAFINEPSTKDIISGDNADFNLTIVALEDIKKGEIIIEVAASSNKALEYDLVVEKQDKLTVRILGKEKVEQEKTSYLFVFLNILILIIIIIIILALAIYIHKRKKKEEEEKQEKATPEAVMVKPGELPTAEISIGSATRPEELPETTEPGKLTVTAVITPETSKPQLPGITPEHEKPGVQQTPQLPPGEMQNKEDNMAETSQGSTEENSTPLIPQDSKEELNPQNC